MTDPLLFFPECDGSVRTAGFWFIEPIPVPKHPMRCPQCQASSSAGEILLRQWRYHVRGTKHAGRNRNRCDVSFKCTVCAYVWVHGLVVPEGHYKRMTRNGPTWHWRQGRELLSGVASTS